MPSSKLLQLFVETSNDAIDLLNKISKDPNLSEVPKIILSSPVVEKSEVMKSIKALRNEAMLLMDLQDIFNCIKPDDGQPIITPGKRDSMYKGKIATIDRVLGDIQIFFDNYYCCDNVEMTASSLNYNNTNKPLYNLTNELYCFDDVKGYLLDAISAGETLLEKGILMPKYVDFVRDKLAKVYEFYIHECAQINVPNGRPRRFSAVKREWYERNRNDILAIYGLSNKEQSEQNEIRNSFIKIWNEKVASYCEDQEPDDIYYALIEFSIALNEKLKNIHICEYLHDIISEEELPVPVGGTMGKIKEKYGIIFEKIDCING